MSPLVSTFAGAALRPYGFTLGGAAPAAFELISSTVLSSNQLSVEFTSIASTWKHLELRFNARTVTAGGDRVHIQFNSDTGSNYAWHRLTGNGTDVQSSSGTSQTTALYAQIASAASGSYQWTPGIVSILDYGSTNKYKTTRTLTGGPYASVALVQLQSGLWLNTSAITSIKLTSASAENFVAGSRFSLYGVKGS